VKYKEKMLMRKTVSMKGGYSLFFEKTKDDDIDCVAYLTGVPINTGDVAKQLKMSEGTVSKYLRNSIDRLYYSIKKRNRELSSLQIMCIMADLLNVESQKEYRKFYKMFPKKIQGEVYDEARETGYTH
jgi:hypothetical protein